MPSGLLAVLLMSGVPADLEVAEAGVAREMARRKERGGERGREEEAVAMPVLVGDEAVQ